MKNKITIITETKCFGGTQYVIKHDSTACGVPMNCGVFLPDADGPRPTLFWLSGLTCTEQNFITKAGAQRAASEYQMILIAPDTSPRGDGVPDDPDGAYDLGLGAGFYVDATQEPWTDHYRMETYISDELPDLMNKHFPADRSKMGVMGHSMGGHGALTMHFRHPEIFKSVSAFAPIVAPSQVPWGQKALSAYLGNDQERWDRYDAASLVKTGTTSASVLIDQGTHDEFLAEQLKPHLFEDAARSAGQQMTLRMQDGYDHSYYFIASFIDDHLRHHAEALGA